MKTPQVKPSWDTGIYIGNGVVAKDNIKNLQNELDFIERKRLEALQAYIDSLTENSK